MCLAIYLPAGAELPEEVIENGLCENPDGAGFAVQTGAGIKSRRFGPDIAPDRFSRSFDTVRTRYPDGNALIHFRWATAGAVTAAMAHPFRVGRWAVAHNGHIGGLKYKPGESDTAAFVRIVLPRLLTLPATNLSSCVEIAAGPGNKLILLPPTGEAIIAGESLGYWIDGIWYSNLGGFDTLGEGASYDLTGWDDLSVNETFGADWRRRIGEDM